MDHHHHDDDDDDDDDDDPCFSGLYIFFQTSMIHSVLIHGLECRYA